MTEETAIIDKIISDIHSGACKADEKLPSENELASRFQVPRITIRKAYERLQELGYIYSKQGRGSFVKDRRNQIPLVLSGNVSFSKKMQEQGYQFESINTFCEEVSYNEQIFQFLGVKETDRVFKVGRLRLIDHKPIALHTSYVAQSVFEHIEKDGPFITSMFDYYQNKGFEDFSSAPSTLSVIFPTKFERDLLHCTSLVPLLAIESGCVDQKARTVLEYTKILYRSDRFIYEI